MPWLRPTLTTLRQQAETDLTTATPASGGGLLRNSVLRILASVNAGLAHLHYGYLDWIATQAVPATATDEYLVMWASLRGITRRLATVASGTATLTGTNGTLVPLGVIIRTSDGREYSTTSTATVSAGTAVVNVTATAAGVRYNEPSGGVAATLTRPVVGLLSGVTLGAVTGGADAESDESLRERMLLRYASPPQGGALTDYVQWAREIPGVTHAWATVGQSLGTVVVYTRINDALPTGTPGGATAETRIAPATGQLLDVANALFPLRPVTAIVFAVAPTPVPQNFSISNLSQDTPTIRAAISAALQQVFLDAADPLGGTLYQSQFEEAITAVAGVDRYTLTTPISPITLPVGAIATLGTVSFV